MIAAFGGIDKIVKLLLEKGADITATKDGRTVLMIAAFGGHDKIVKLLLEKGAEINAVAKRGRTALIIAASAGHSKVVELLLRRGAIVNAQAENGETALLALKVLEFSDEMKRIIAELLVMFSLSPGAASSIPKGGSTYVLKEFP